MAILEAIIKLTLWGNYIFLDSPPPPPSKKVNSFCSYFCQGGMHCAVLKHTCLTDHCGNVFLDPPILANYKSTTKNDRVGGNSKATAAILEHISGFLGYRITRLQSNWSLAPQKNTHNNNTMV